jgi:hypothetical protein
MVLFLYILMFFHPMDLFDQPVKHIAQALLWSCIWNSFGTNVKIT